MEGADQGSRAEDGLGSAEDGIPSPEFESSTASTRHVFASACVPSKKPRTQDDRFRRATQDHGGFRFGGSHRCETKLGLPGIVDRHRPPAEPTWPLVGGAEPTMKHRAALEVQGYGQADSQN